MNFKKTLLAAMPKMIGNPLSVATAMVSFALSVVKGQKAKKATKGKKKTTVRKSKILSKKQKLQMEVMERICQSVYGTYIRGATTIAARYIGHPAVTIPASEMVKTMMDEVAPPINKYCVIHTEQKQKIETNDIVQIAQIYKNAIEETKQYLKDKKLYIPTVNDYLLTGYNGTIQSVQYLMDKYCPELGETLDNIKAKKAEMISYFYENNRQIYIKNPEIGTVFDKMLFDVPIDEKNMNVFEKAEVAMDGVASGFIKDIASGANAIVDMALSPLDTAEALTSPGALTLGTVWNGLTEDVVNDWKKGTIQGKTEAVGRTISIISPIEILKATGIIGKGTKVAGTLGKTANVVDTAVDVAKRTTDVADTAVDLTKKITDAGDTVVDITKGLDETADGLANTGKNFTDDITKKFEDTNSAKKPSIETDDVLQQKPDKTPEQKPKEVPEQKPNETPEQNTKKPSETDDIITVERGNSGVNGHDNVEFSGAKPKSNINDVKTIEKDNNKPDEVKAIREKASEIKVDKVKTTENTLEKEIGEKINSPLSKSTVKEEKEFLENDIATTLFLPDEFYSKNLPNQVAPGTKYLPKYDEFGNVKQIKIYDDYGREIERVDYTNFLPDEFYSKNLPNQVAPGTKYLPKYDEFGNVKQIKMYDDYGREIGWVDYTNHGYGNIGSPDYHTVPHWHERIYDAQNRDGMKVNHRTDINTPLGGK